MPRPDYGQLEADQIARLTGRRQARDAAAVSRSLETVRDMASTYRDDEKVAERQSLMPAIIDAVRARATVGEVADVLRAEWGAFTPA